ncbi:MAG: DUF5684 domain-containing protein [Polyangiaceae bacterium]|nr:DUF5684 domain-containing protein [Polyangiaceae bacterium]
MKRSLYYECEVAHPYLFSEGAVSFVEKGSSGAMETNDNIYLALSGLFYLAIGLLMVAASWNIYTKAGQPGWASLVPFYNMIVLLKIVGRPMWWMLLLFLPLVNLVAILIISIDLAKSFGRGTGFGIGLFFFSFVFYPVLAWNQDEYQGPALPN